MKIILNRIHKHAKRPLFSLNGVRDSSYFVHSSGDTGLLLEYIRVMLTIKSYKSGLERIITYGHNY